MDTGSNRKWITKNYQEKYKRDILAMFKKEYPDSNLWKESFFEWQNFNNPAGNSVIKLAISDKDEVVGFYCVAPQNFMINGKLIKGSFSLNTLVREDYRGLGIFIVLATECFQECLRRRIMFTLGFPNKNSYSGFIKKLNFTDLGEMPLLLKPYKLSNLLGYKFKHDIFRYLGKPFDWVLSLMNRSNSEKGGGIVKPEDIGGLWKRMAKNHNVTIRDYSFFNWRTRWPGRKYKIYYQKYNGEIMGYIVLGISVIDNVKNGLVVDMVVKNDKKLSKTIKNLLLKANGYWSDMGVDQVVCLWSKNSPEFNEIKRIGYFECPDFLKPQPMRPVVRWHGKVVPKDFYVLDKWRLSFIDYDVA